MSSRPRIALLGLYGGLFRENNPGCVLILQKTIHELGRRIDGRFDAFCLDALSEHGDLEREDIHGRTIQLFSRNKLSLGRLEEELLDCDAVVVGGDVVWGGPIAWGTADVAYDSRELYLNVFLLNAFPKFMSSQIPLAFNCVHSYAVSDASRRPSDAERELFVNACSRAAYVSVRTEHIKSELNRFGIEDVQCVPDPVLDLSLSDLGTWEPDPRLMSVFQQLEAERKPTVGISVAPSRVRYLIRALSDIDLADHDVWAYPFSRYYNNIESVFLLKKAFGDRFKYIEHYMAAFDVCKLVGTFDVNVNDTLHGTLAALAQGKSVITMEHDRRSLPGASKKQATLQYVGLENAMIRLPFGIPDLHVEDDEYRKNVSQLTTELGRLLETKPQAEASGLADTKSRIQRHFDEMAARINTRV